ncbi:metalloendopeptidase [Sorochytrium milnesiophthora]
MLGSARAASARCRAPARLFSASRLLQSSWQRPRASYQRFQTAVPWYQNRNYLVGGGVLSLAGGAYYVTHLEHVPISGRRRFMDLSPQQEEMLAKQAYEEIVAQYGRQVLPQSHAYTKMVRKVAQRIVQVSGMTDLHWEFYVIDSPEKNAFVLPGGKVFVFTGILPVVQGEDGLAVILGHEIAHQLARHSAEKMSFMKILVVLQLALSVVFDTSHSFNQLITQLGVLLPFSRKMENEADEIGLLLAAQACYNPSEAVNVWKRMAKEEGDAGTPQFLSTHPSSTSRIERISRLLPMAEQKRAESNCHSEANYLTQMFSHGWSKW